MATIKELVEAKQKKKGMQDPNKVDLKHILGVTNEVVPKNQNKPIITDATKKKGSN